MIAIPPPGRELDLVTVGDTGVDLMVRVDAQPGRDGKAIGTHLGMFGGGMAANFAAAAKLAAPDARVALVSRVADDAFGTASLADLRRRGLDVSRVTVRAGGDTWWCAVSLDASGEKALLGGRTPDSLPLATDIDLSVAARTRWLHVLGDVPSAADVLRAAQDAGAVASVDVEASFVAEEPDRAGDLVARADLAILNAPGVRALTGLDDDEEAARTAAARHGNAVLVTRGAAGSLLAADGRVHTRDAAPVPRVADTTGAGDSFAGTFTARLLAGDDPPAALAAGARAAAETIGHLGARPGRLRTGDTTETGGA